MESSYAGAAGSTSLACQLSTAHTRRVFVSVTRLRLRSLRFLPAFLWRNQATIRQIEQTPGFIEGKLLMDGARTFWTLTLWQDAETMRAYRNSGSHKEAMPKLKTWCDEASVAHWEQEEATLPGWDEVARRMDEEGRSSKVDFPSPAHLQKHIARPRISSRMERSLHAKSG